MRPAPASRSATCPVASVDAFDALDDFLERGLLVESRYHD
jgi:hypothetical protein